MKMVSMKMSKAEADKMAEPSTLAGGKDEPRYPWGLSINLDNDSLKKLGIETDMPEVGEAYTLHAKVKVTSCSSNETQGSGKNSSVGLQITDMMLDDGGDDSKTSEALYKK